MPDPPVPDYYGEPFDNGLPITETKVDSLVLVNQPGGILLGSCLVWGGSVPTVYNGISTNFNSVSLPSLENDAKFYGVALEDAADEAFVRYERAGSGRIVSVRVAYDDRPEPGDFIVIKDTAGRGMSIRNLGGDVDANIVGIFRSERDSGFSGDENADIFVDVELVDLKHRPLVTETIVDTSATAKKGGATFASNSTGTLQNITIPDGDFDGQIKWVIAEKLGSADVRVIVTNHVLGSPYNEDLKNSGESVGFVWSASNGTWATFSPASGSGISGEDNFVVFAGDGSLKSIGEMVLKDGEFIRTLSGVDFQTGRKFTNTATISHGDNGIVTPEGIGPVIHLAGSSGEGRIHLESAGGSASAAPGLIMGRSNGTLSSRTIAVSGDSLGKVEFTGFDGTDYAPAARIRSEVNGTPGSNDMPGALIFSTSPDGSQTPADRLKILANGQITVNTTLSSIVVDGFTANPQTLIVSSDSLGSALALGNYSNNENLPPSIAFLRGKGTASSPAIVGPNTILGLMIGTGWDGSDFQTAADIIFKSGGDTPADGSLSGRVEIRTRKTTGAITPKVAVDPDGILHAFGQVRSYSGRVVNYLLDVAGGTINLNETHHHVTVTVADTTIMLPSASPGLVGGRMYSIKRRHTGMPSTIDGNGENIDGNPTYLLNLNNESVILIFDGDEWAVL